MAGMNVEELKGAIIGLSEEDRVSLTSWLNLHGADDWDLEMRRDFAPGGKGSNVLERWRREAAEGLADGSVRPIEEGLAKRTAQDPGNNK